MKNLTVLITIAILSLNIPSSHATNPVSPEAFNAQSLELETSAAQSFLGKTKLWLTKKVTKHVFSSIGDISDEKIEKYAQLSLIYGRLSVLAFSLVMLFGFLGLFVAIPLGIITCILSSLVFRATSKDKVKFKSSRNKAALGLVMGVLSSIAPLLFYLLVIAVFRILLN